MKQHVRDILQSKGSDVFSVSPLATVIDAVTIMNDNHIGSVLVMEKSEPVGIFTERDVLVRVVAANRDPRRTQVGEVMTTRLHTVTPDTPAYEVMHIISSRRCRHIPVVEDDKIIGLVSAGDIAKLVEQKLSREVRELSTYIGGPYLS